MVVIKFPFTSMQQFNLDWIMQQLHKMLQFMPMNGVAGDVLQRNVDGAVWMPLTAVSLDIHSMSTIPEVEGADELAIYDNSLQGNYKVTVQDLLDAATPPVTSVNGQTGAVVLSIPSDTSDLTNTAGFVDAAGAAAAAPVQSVNGLTGAVTIPLAPVYSVNGQTGTVVLGKSEIGLGNVDNVQQYSASNPPPYPVTSVNGMTGDVIVGGGGGSVTKDLLWTNSSPNSNFAAQTISMSLSSYLFVVIEMVYDVDASVCFIFPVTTSRDYNYITGIYPAGKFERRAFTIGTSGIQFFGGEVMATYAGTWSANDGYAVPYRIYGIK